MIGFAEQHNEQALLQALDIDPIFGSRIYTLYTAYAGMQDMADTWIYTENEVPLGALMRFSGVLTVVADECVDMNEIAVFAHTIGGINQIEGLEYTVLKLNLYLHCLVENGSIMCYQGQPYEADNSHIDRNPSYRTVYDIIAKSDPEFEEFSTYEDWLVDISHRQRRGLAKMITYQVDGEAVSSAGIYFIGKKISLIGGVATLPEHQHKGYAKKVVQAITAYVIEDGRLPVLIPAFDELMGFYEQLGYGEVARRAILFLHE